MKFLPLLLFVFPSLCISQIEEDYFRRELIDSIHTKRLCVDYPGLWREQTTQEAYNEAVYVFTGKVVQIIRTEQLEPHDGYIDEHGNLIYTDYWPTYKYWYVFEPYKIYKGEETTRIKVHARTFSTVSPLLILEKEYLIYALEGEVQEDPYFHCNGNSSHLRYAKKVIQELEVLIKD